MTLTFDLSTKIGISLTRVLENVYANFDFSTFMFSSYELVLDRRTNRRTGKTRDEACGTAAR